MWPQGAEEKGAQGNKGGNLFSRSRERILSYFGDTDPNCSNGSYGACVTRGGDDRDEGKHMHFDNFL